MTEPRIVPPEEARQIAERYARFTRPEVQEQRTLDLAHTAAVLGEQREAVLALHERWDDSAGNPLCGTCHDESYPCRTVIALGVTE